MSMLHEIADAVCIVLDSYAFAVPVSPVVTYDTELELEDIDTLHCDIVPAGLTQEPSSRITLDNEISVDVALRYRFGVDDQDSDGTISVAKIQQHLDTLEDIAKYLAKKKTLPTYRGASWRRNNIKAPWVPDHLNRNRQYTGILQVVYSGEEDLS